MATTLIPSEAVARSVGAETKFPLTAFQQTVATGTIGGGVVDRALRIRGIRARLQETGTAGTCTVQLHRNGVLVTGAAVSITNADTDGTVRQAGIAEVVAASGDQLEFVVSAAGTGQTDLAVELLAVEDY